MSIQKAKDNRVRCFICKQWQKAKYTMLVEFHEIEETVCILCYKEILAREDSLDIIKGAIVGDDTDEQEDVYKTDEGERSYGTESLSESTEDTKETK